MNRWTGDDLTQGDSIAAAFARQPRQRFVPEAQTFEVDEDRPLPIGHGQTNSQPTTVVNMLRLLDVRSGHKVLDVGSGSGWTTALLGELVGPTGRVHGVEILPELVAAGRRALGEVMDWATIEQVSGLGLPDQAPFDRILVSAMADDLPQILVDQLTDGGVLVIPVRGQMLRVVRRGDEHVVTEHGAYNFVPLITDTPD